jgi:hypothetical protein
MNNSMKLEVLFSSGSKKAALCKAKALRAEGQSVKVYEKNMMVTSIGVGLVPFVEYLVAKA